MLQPLRLIVQRADLQVGGCSPIDFESGCVLVTVKAIAHNSFSVSANRSVTLCGSICMHCVFL